ncbi:hypothetical protein PENTCL1PPCAC_21199, partial [Pristionchus entomophagus]
RLLLFLFLSVFFVDDVFSTADTQGTEFQVVFPRNVELKSTNCTLSITVVNPNNVDVQISISYYKTLYDTSSLQSDTLTVPAGGLITQSYPQFLAWEYMNGGFQEQFDTRVRVTATGSVTVYANNYNQDGFGDSFLVLPHSMAGASYSFTLPIPAANQNGVTQYAIAYIIPTTADVNVELTVGTWNEKRLIPVKPGSSVNYFAVAYTTKLTDPPTFNLNGDKDFLVISAVSCLPTSNGKCDYAVFMPSPLLLTGVCDSNKVDWHPTDLITSRKLSVTPNVPSNVCASTVKIYDDSNTVTDQITNASTIYNVAQTFGDRVILSTSFPTVPIRIGSLAASGGAFLTGLASTTQFVTGTTHFMTRTEKATVYIVIASGNQDASLTISLDG